MPSAADIKAASAYVELVLRDKLSTQLAKVGDKIRAWGKSISGVGMKAFGGALPGPVSEFLRMATSPAGAFVGFQAAAKIWADAGDAINDAAAATGMAVENLSRLKYAAEANDVSLESLQGSIVKMQRALVNAAQGAAEPNEALQAMGLTIRDFAGLDGMQQFLLFADKISQIKDPAMRSAAAMAIFGKSAAELFPLIMQGREGIEGLIAEAEKLGFVMGTKDAEAADQLHAKFGLVQRALTGVVKAIGGAVAAMQSDMLDKTLNLLLGLRDWIKANKDLVTGIAKTVAMVVAGGGALVLFGGVLSAVAGIFTAAATAATFLATVLGVLFTTLPGLIFSAVAGTTAWVVGMEGLGKAWEWIKKQATSAMSLIQTSMDAVWNAMSGGEMQIAWNVVTTGASAAWASVSLGFQKAWSGVRDYIKETFRDAFDDMIKWWHYYVAVAKTTWIDVREAMVSGMLTAIETIWSKLVEVIARMGEMMSNTFTDIMDNLPDMMGGISEADATARREQAKADREQRVDDAKNIFQDTRAARQTAANEEKTRAVTDQKEADKKTDKAAEKRKTDRDKATKGELSAAQAAADLAKSLWEKAVAAANGVNPDRWNPQTMKPAGVFDLEAAGKSYTFGSFSGAALSAAGRGGPMAPMLEEQKKTNGLLLDLAGIAGDRIAVGIDRTVQAVAKLKNAVFK